jgi:hypothetical protein
MSKAEVQRAQRLCRGYGGFPHTYSFLGTKRSSATAPVLSAVEGMRSDPNALSTPSAEAAYS